MTELCGYPHGNIETDGHDCDVQGGSVIDPGRSDKNSSGHNSHEPGKEDLLGGTHPLV